MKPPTINQLVATFDLQPHPEGGYYREIYRSVGSSVSGDEKLQRNHGTQIYYLLPEGKKSVLHRLRSDEVWHFYLGGPLELVMLEEKRGQSPQVSTITIGPDILNDQRVCHVVHAGIWFGATPLKGSGYSFIGCTVVPGFSFEDFEIGSREQLLKLFPQHAALVQRFTT